MATISDIKEQYENCDSNDETQQLLGQLRLLRTLRIGSVVRHTTARTQYVVTWLYYRRSNVFACDMVRVGGDEAKKKVPMEMFEVVA